MAKLVLFRPRMRLILFVSILSLPALGSDREIPFGGSIVHNIKTLQERSASGHRPDCGKVDLYGNQISCSTDPNYLKKYTVVKRDYTKYSDIPEELKPFIKKYTNDSFSEQFKSVSFFFVIKNDNRQLVGLGTKENGKFGDDFGDTASTEFGFTGSKENGERYQLSFESQLFTTPIPNTLKVDDRGGKSMHQNYLNQNVLKVVLDDIEAGRAEFWAAEAGFVQITNSNRLGIMEGSKQQSVFHNFLNRHSPHIAYGYKNVEDGSKDRYGAYVSLLTGLQSQFAAGNSCFLESKIYGGAKVSTLPKDSFVTTGAKGTFGFKLPLTDSTIKTSAQADVTKHSAGSLRSLAGEIAVVGSGGTTAAFNATRYSGQLINTTGKNIPNIYAGKPDTKIGFYFSIPIK